MKIVVALFAFLQFLNVSNSVASPIGQIPFDKSDVDSQAYWYSRYNLGHLVMRSGMGVQLKPNPKIMKKAFQMVNDGFSSAMAPQNPALLKRVYNSGIPEFAGQSNGVGTDFNNFRWTSTDKGKTTMRSFGWTMMKEVEWSKQFNVDFHFGSPGDDSGIPGAQQRFAGLVLCIEAFQQAMDYSNDKSNYISNTVSGDYVAMAALSSFSRFVKVKDTILMSNNRCAKIVQAMSGMDAIDSGNMLRGLAEEIYISLGVPQGVEQLSTAIQSLAWFAATDSLMAVDAKAKLEGYAWTLSQIEAVTASDLGYQLRAFVEMARISKNPFFYDLITDRFSQLSVQFDDKYGIFGSQKRYTVEEIAAILGGLNAVLHYGGDKVDSKRVVEILVGSFEALVNLSGLQRSAPPVMDIPAYERSSEMAHHYPTVRTPVSAGGKFGVAPVYGSVIEFDSSSKTWKKNIDNSFDTSGAMHLANEMIWFHKFEVNGFPEVK